MNFRGTGAILGNFALGLIPKPWYIQFKREVLHSPFSYIARRYSLYDFCRQSPSFVVEPFSYTSLNMGPNGGALSDPVAVEVVETAEQLAARKAAEEAAKLAAQRAAAERAIAEALRRKAAEEAAKKAAEEAVKKPIEWLPPLPPPPLPPEDKNCPRCCIYDCVRITQRVTDGAVEPPVGQKFNRCIQVRSTNKTLIVNCPPTEGSGLRAQSFTDIQTGNVYQAIVFVKCERVSANPGFCQNPPCSLISYR